MGGCRSKPATPAIPVEKMAREMSAMTEDGRLLLTSMVPASHPDFLVSRGVTHVLTVMMTPLDARDETKITYLHLQVEDRPTQSLTQILPRAHEFIQEALDSDPKNICLVHCAAGVSRSASVVITFLMKQNGWDLRHAFQWVKQRRPQVCPNAGFYHQICVWSEANPPPGAAPPDSWMLLAEFLLETRLNGGASVGVTAEMMRQALIETNGVVTEAQLRALAIADAQRVANATNEQAPSTAETEEQSPDLSACSSREYALED